MPTLINAMETPALTTLFVVAPVPSLNKGGGDTNHSVIQQQLTNQCYGKRIKLDISQEQNALFVSVRGCY